MTKLSIIVPVYNVAPYLRKCVDSLLSQDFSDYEIILIDDGSTDGSSTICDEYASRPFDNSFTPSLVIKTIHQKNAGLSAARNTGIAAAKGEYICFVDSDDYWQSKVLGSLMAQVEREQLDVLRFDYQNVRQIANGQYEVFEPYKTPRYIDYCTDIVDGYTYLNNRMRYACYAVMFIIRRAILLSNDQRPSTNDQVLFTPGLHFEDVDWLPRMMLNAKRVNSTPLVVYNYFMRQGSITKTQGNLDKARKNIEDQMLIIERYKQYRQQYPQCYWLHRMQSFMAVNVLTCVARDFYSERHDYIRRLSELRAFPLSIANQGRTFVRRAQIINLLGKDVFCFIMHTYSKYH